MVDVVMVSEAVAGLLAAGGVKELGEAAGGGLVAGIIDRVKKVFGSDARSVDALERTRAGDKSAVAELARLAAPGVGRTRRSRRNWLYWAAQAGGEQDPAGPRGP